VVVVLLVVLLVVVVSPVVVVVLLVVLLVVVVSPVVVVVLVLVVAEQSVYALSGLAPPHTKLGSGQTQSTPPTHRFVCRTHVVSGKLQIQ
jgi:hypothetical protein